MSLTEFYVAFKRKNSITCYNFIWVTQIHRPVHCTHFIRITARLKIYTDVPDDDAIRKNSIYKISWLHGYKNVFSAQSRK